MSLTEKDILDACEEIDTLLLVGVGAKYHKKEGPLHHRFYEAAREKLGDKPLTYIAAKKILEKVEPESTVLFLTGFMVPPWIRGETDGPPGTAVLARFLNLGLGVTPVIITDREQKGIVAETCKAAGLYVSENIDRVKGIPTRALIDYFPINEEKAKRKAQEVLDKYNPSIIIAIERPGYNEKGVYHSRSGIDISPVTGKCDYIVELARDKGITTIGMVDGGNEIGCGLILDTVKKYVLNATKCRCPCGAGIAAVTATDILIPAFISNWAAYGVEAALALILNRPDLMHDGESEKRIIDGCVRGGGTSSPLGTAEPLIDGLPNKYNVYIVELLNYLVKSRTYETYAAQRYREILKAPEEKIKRIHENIKKEAKYMQ